jgi:hypothetical protein
MWDARTLPVMVCWDGMLGHAGGDGNVTPVNHIYRSDEMGSLACDITKWPLEGLEGT